MNDNHLTALLEYLSRICPNRGSMTEVRLRLIFFWAEWHCVLAFGKTLTDTPWTFGELGPIAPEFTTAVSRLWGGPYSSSIFDLDNHEKICLEGAVHYLGHIHIRQAMKEVRELWVSRQAIWSYPIDMVNLGQRLQRGLKDVNVYQTTKQMSQKEILRCR